MRTRSHSSRPSSRARTRTSIGLDIGSTAVRAAEVRLRKDSWEIVRYGQVGLPLGAVVDGEIQDADAVEAALRRLWSAAGFSHRRVIVGVSGQRVVVRQADVPNLADKEMRSAIAFRIEDLIPLPASNVEFDVRPIGDRPAGGGGDRTVVLGAAHGDVVRALVGVARAAKLQIEAVDAVPLALIRAATSGQTRSGGELLVSIGGDLSVVAVMQDGEPAFIRMLGRGGRDVTRALAEATTHDLAAAEAAKRLTAGLWAEPQGRSAADAERRRLVTEVRETLAFFRSRPEGSPTVERVLVTGGGIRTAGLLDELAADLGLPVTVVDVPHAGQLAEAGLAYGEAALAAPAALTPVGLALWPVAPAYSRLDLYPVALRTAAAQRRNKAIVVAAGAVVVVACLGAAGYREAQLRHLHHEVAVTNAQIATAQAESAKYSAVTDLQAQVNAARSQATQALTGDVNWIGLLSEIGAREPAGVTLQTFSGQATALLGQPPATGGTPVGTVTMTGQFNQKLTQVSDWLQALESIPPLQDTWVNSVSAPSGGSGTTSDGTFSADASVGSQALSTRANDLPGGSK